VGLDGCSWNVLEPLLESGRLPHLQALRERGAHGVLESTIPFYTGPAWASFATGSSPAAHGIWDFLIVRADDRLTPAHESDLRRVTYYELLAGDGRPSVLVNLPLDLDGGDGLVIVNSWLTTDERRRIFPTDRAERYASKVKRYKSYPETFDAPLGSHLEDLLTLEQSRFELARELMAGEDWEHFFLLFSSTDWLGHAATGLFLAGDAEAHSAFLRLYEQLDAYVGWVRQRAPEALLIVLSDHGQCEETHVVHVNGLLYELGLVRQIRERPAEVLAALDGETVKGTLRVPGVLSPLRSSRAARVAARATKKALRRGLGVELVTPRRGLDADRVLSRAYLPTVASYAVYTRDCSDEELQQIRAALEEARLDDGRAALDGVWSQSELYGFNPSPPAPTFVFAPATGVRPSVHIRSPVTERVPTHGRGAHQRDGIVLLDGPGISGTELGRVSLYDLCPTLLWYMDAAVPAGIDGRILFEAFTQETVESKEVRETQEVAPARQPGAVDSEQVERRLRDLGYI
jgi:predicted AlkP superfamily phosphohydrolase/phosphomutase